MSRTPISLPSTVADTENRCHHGRVTEQGLTPEQATGVLRDADRSATMLEDHTRWVSWYLAAFGVAWAVLTFVVGMQSVRMLAIGAGWAAVVVGLVWWSDRRLARGRDFYRRTKPYWVATSISYAAAVGIGMFFFAGELWFWTAAAAVTAAPMVVGAYRERAAH
jgi:hypothetical protein